MGGDAPWRRPDQSTWSDSSARAVLQLMVESVAELVGFEMAALSVVLGDELVTLAYTGPEEHREYMEESDPVSVIEPVLARATSWGARLRFLEATPVEELEGHWVRFEQVPTDHPDAWGPDDEPARRAQQRRRRRRRDPLRRPARPRAAGRTTASSACWRGTPPRPSGRC